MRETPHWEEYVQTLHIRFGTTVFEDHVVESMRLKQTGELEECLEAFESLLDQVCLPKEYVISCLLAAIREDIVYVVRMQRPKSLLETYASAWPQNINLKHSRGHNHTFLGFVAIVTGVTQRPLFNSNEGHKPASGILPMPRWHIMTNKGDERTSNSRRLTGVEMDEKMRKGRCFWYNEKFTFGHKCRSRQLHIATIDQLEQVIGEM